MKKRTQRKPARRQDSEKWRQIEDWAEKYQIAGIVKQSYVLSRTWAWASRIQLTPTVRIPIPRFLSHRED